MQQLRWLIGMSRNDSAKSKMQRSPIGHRAVSQSPTSPRHSDTCILTLDLPGFDSPTPATPTLTTPTAGASRYVNSTVYFEEADAALDHNVGANAIYDPMADSHNRSCLKALQTTDPRKDKERIEKSNGGLFRDSCLWILGNVEFKQWRSHSRSNLLWIKGDPGKGKTMLLSSIIDELSSTAESGHQEACTLSYFFCQASDLRTNNAGAVLRGLIYMLADCQPVLLSHARKRYDHVGDQLFTDSNSLEALSKMFSAIVQDRRLNDTYVIIDALDECIRDREFLIDLITQLSATNSKIKWLVSSRNLPSIEEGFTMAQKLEVSLELNEKFISTALGIYVQHKVAELAKVKGYTEDMQAAIHHYLYSNASNSFLWVALVCQDLAKIPMQSNILLNLTEFPARLDALYTYMLDQICGSDMSKLCLHMLAITSVVYRPITVDELSCFVDMLDGALDEKILIHAIGLCSSFLTIYERTILFVHQSAKDFLVGNATDTVFKSGMVQVHYTVFSQSLQVLSKTLRRDIYGLDAPGFPIDQIKRPDPDPLAAARYACVYWVKHLVDSIKLVRQHGDLHDGGTVDTFLRTKYLYWLESLSLLNSLPEGALSISKLQHLLQEKANAPYFLEIQSDNTHEKTDKSQLADLVRYAHRFIKDHMASFQSSPLQVYTSALVFSPPDSLIKNLFTHEEPGWIVTKPNADDEEWIPGIQTLKGHGEQIYSMVFSPDGVWLASVSVDGTVQIWNLETGYCQQTLRVHRDSVYSVAFLPNSSTLIISGMEDNSIQVWDTVTNQMLQALKGHGDTIRAIDFSSSNNDLLASGSWDHTVRIWDLATSSCLQTLQGHDGDVCTIAFSPDGVRLASGSSDRTIKVWDPVNGFCLHTLYRHNVASTAIAFTPDGTKLVSALSNDGVVIWDLATGQCLHTVFVGTPLRKLTFDVTGSFLHTDRGTISLDFLSSQATGLEPYMRGYWISPDNQWIKQKSDNLLWLPPDYWSTSSALSRAPLMSLIALGSSSGRILILRLLGSSDPHC
ncbi:hypothetical protein M441DRAFT_60566 [Trichoderma asperellum CBS 433.97]|uniref:NACHT domain-containing protein n=1 Tax=Trichoderma asperellum (strain ATCC 204424 / CBS 433.97 / NBRC 101777) TaxID=1042311 RepID=A0A2T3Z0J9_TRIA4|nr:hypothetical protein M441DRAFT_60566 [Trichoderma asperellum CBS 433.97]PTB38317.1 hypothetical protein M441DRAFT_60566 [Trichoderma asperellum CBS 433.97]